MCTCDCYGPVLVSARILLESSTKRHHAQSITHSVKGPPDHDSVTPGRISWVPTPTRRRRCTARPRHVRPRRESLMSQTETEIATQPECWNRAVALARRPDAAGVAELPRAGERVAVVGCGTSWFMAHAYAVLRESRGHGETDAFAASEMPVGRRYDRVVALTRSGTTTEVLEVLRRLRGVTPTVAVTADPATPVMELADAACVLEFADETSVVQTRFATTELVFLRALLGEDLSR